MYPPGPPPGQYPGHQPGPPFGSPPPGPPFGGPPPGPSFGSPVPAGPQGPPPLGFPPPLPVPPHRPGRSGRTVLLVFALIAALICCGGPAAFGIRYAMFENGPYGSPPNVCLTMNSPTAKALQSGQPPNPDMQFATDPSPKIGCDWTRQGAFVFSVDVQIYHKRATRDSVDEAISLFEFSRKISHDPVVRDHPGIGDQSFLTLDDSYRKVRLVGLVRVGNAHVEVWYTTYRQSDGPLPEADRQAQLTKFEATVRALVADVLEDLH